MTKNQIFLEVFESEGFSVASVVIIAWLDQNKTQMCEAYITEEFFDDLENMEIDDLSEGEMEYSGDLSVEKLKEELKNKGFTIIP